MIELTEKALNQILIQAGVTGALIGILIGIWIIALAYYSHRLNNFRRFEKQYYRLLTNAYHEKTDHFDILKDALKTIEDTLEILAIRYNNKMFRHMYNEVISLLSYLTKYLPND